MEEDMIDAEINRITNSNKKRKVQAELPKHVCWAAQKIEHGSSTEQKKARFSMFEVGEPSHENPNEIRSSRHEASRSFKSETTSIVREELDRLLYHDYGLDPSDEYEDELQEFENLHIDNKDLDAVASPSNYVVLSIDHQDTLEESKTQTIDKEFEE